MEQVQLKRNRNSGFSLIELIVAVLIIGIASTITVLSVSYAHSMNASRTAQKLSSYLDLTRTQAMSMEQDSVVLRIERNSEGEYYVVSLQVSNTGVFTELDREELCNKALDISYDRGTGLFVPLAKDSSIDIAYKKDSGSFTKTIDTTKPIVPTNPFASMLDPIQKIRITGSKTATLVLVGLTGRNYVQ
jgi:prepilin-type N-terminal cleavage/methylation domain-containing protein